MKKHANYELPSLFRKVLVLSSLLAVFAGQLGNVVAQDGSPFSSVACSGIIKIIDSAKLPGEGLGVLQEVRVREGDLVKKGQLLGRIQSAGPQLELDQAKRKYEVSKTTAASDVDIRFAEKSLELAKADLERAFDSNRRVKNSVPKPRLERLRLEVHRNELQLEQAQRDQRIATMELELDQNDVRMKELQLQKCEIIAPFDGMVVAVETKQNEWVQPGQTIIKLVRLDRLKIEGFVTAAEASVLRKGAEVRGTVQGKSPIGFTGRLIFINPEANPVNMRNQVWVEIEKVDDDVQLTPGLAAKMNINTSN